MKKVNIHREIISLHNMKVIGLLLLLIISFSNNIIAQSGKENFDKLCMTCHSLSSKNLVGPGLAGMTERYDEEWLVNWIQNSQAMIDANDEDAVKIFNEYNQMPMPSFPQLSEHDIKEIITYIKENEETETLSSTSTGGTTNGSGSDSGTTLWGEYDYIAFLIIIALSLWFYFFRRKSKIILKHNGYHDDPHKIPNYTFLFIAYLGIAALITSVFVKLLENNAGKINEIMFVALPYLCVGIFFIGTIYRYLRRGFQVSSLSTQFLEGRKLFWGSQPFHWSILILFFGHLIAFLFPASIIAWNGNTVRLLILEFSSFAFGLTALIGVILLIKRRLSSKTLKVVANKMDMVVYTVLITQILSGLGVAFFLRWGSSWFSSVLSPYLISVFSFNPDISAVSEMPWLIQIHIISAFVIIGIIPFTRFVHFLVAPIDYIWRRYQLVIWNWNPKNIRASTKWNFGKKPRNH